MGDRYTPIPHRTGFELIDTVLNTNGGHYEAAGYLGSEERVWGMADLGASTWIKGTDDKTDHYLLFSTSHDGSTGWELKAVAIRLVCENGITSAVSPAAQSAFRIRHTGDVDAKVNAAQKIIIGFRNRVANLEELFNMLARKTMTKEVQRMFFKALFPVKENEGGTEVSGRTAKTIEQILENYHGADGGQSKPVAGSAYMFLNGLTEFVDHQRSTKAKDGKTETARATSSVFGSGAKLKNRALDTLVGLAPNLPDRNIAAQPQVYDMAPAPAAEGATYTGAERLLSMVDIG